MWLLEKGASVLPFSKQKRFVAWTVVITTDRKQCKVIKLRIKEPTVKNLEFQLLLLNGYNLTKAKMNADKEATELRTSALFTCGMVPVTGTRGSGGTAPTPS